MSPSHLAAAWRHVARPSRSPRPCPLRRKRSVRSPCRHAAASPSPQPLLPAAPRGSFSSGSAARSSRHPRPKNRRALSSNNQTIYPKTKTPTPNQTPSAPRRLRFAPPPVVSLRDLDACLTRSASSSCASPASRVPAAPTRAARGGGGRGRSSPSRYALRASTSYSLPGVIKQAGAGAPLQRKLQPVNNSAAMKILYRELRICRHDGAMSAGGISDERCINHVKYESMMLLVRNEQPRVTRRCLAGVFRAGHQHRGQLTKGMFQRYAKTRVGWRSRRRVALRASCFCRLCKNCSKQEFER